MQNRSLPQANSTRPRVGRSLVELEVSLSLSPTPRLGVCQPPQEGQATILAGSLFRVHLQPALEAAEIPGDVGWHTLRHTFGTLMKAKIKTIQELLRHSNYKVTADTYTQAITPTKRAAQTKLVKMILPS